MRDPASRHKDVEVRIRTTRDTCWTVGSGGVNPDGTRDDGGACGSYGWSLSDDDTVFPRRR